MHIRRPIITEKSLSLAGRGWYTFAADVRARKEDIASDIAKLYAVNVVAVRTISMHGKMRRSGKRMTMTKKSDWKKALVMLKSGQKIDAFEVTKEPEPNVEEKPAK